MESGRTRCARQFIIARNQSLGCAHSVAWPLPFLLNTPTKVFLEIGEGTLPYPSFSLRKVQMICGYSNKFKDYPSFSLFLSGRGNDPILDFEYSEKHTGTSYFYSTRLLVIRLLGSISVPVLVEHPLMAAWSHGCKIEFLCTLIWSWQRRGSQNTSTRRGLVG